jgi:hypothetical protein
MGGLQDKELARRLANGDRDLLRHLRDDFGRAAQKVADEAKRKILEADSKHPGTLRKEISATVTTRGRVTQTGLSAEIKSDGMLMPGQRQNLPAYANSRGKWKRWRHPVYARSDQSRAEWTWVTEEWLSAQGWFDDTIQDHSQDFADAAQHAIDENIAYLEGRL